MTYLSISRVGWLILAVSLYIVIALNGSFWAKLFEVTDPQSLGEWVFLASVFVVVTSLNVLVLTLFATPYALKTVAAVLIVLAAVINYFMSAYGTVIDVGMMRNVLQTDAAETRDLISWGAIAHVALFGLLPAALVIAVPLNWPPFGTYFKANVARGLATGLVCAVLFGWSAGTFASVFRENKVLLYKLTPSNAISAVTQVASRSLDRPRGPLVVIGSDAHVEQPVSTAVRPRVTVVVVGETARAQNFSLFGYERKTNPKLETAPDLIAFRNASSCGTETAVSVPCMFSGLGRQNFSNEEAERRENLLDVVKRTGQDVLWRENQAGCKGVCARVKTEMLTRATDPRFCGEECHDEILVDGLEERIAGMDQGGVIVLHMMGSHGPAYYKRVPDAFAIFQPICRSSEFSKCTPEELVNSYDNTIVYSDHVLAELLKVLDRSAKAGIDTALFYVSDHGESLGEHGLYLHGMPYALAPKQQTHVPMILWLSEGARSALEVDGGCMRSAAQSQAVSQDNLFHTVLGLQGIRTNIYRADLDLTAGCRRQPHVQAR